MSGCSAEGFILGATREVGGLVGTNNGSITESYSEVNLNASDFAVGGLVGMNSGSISNSYSGNNTIYSTNSVGGLVGSNNGTIEKCYSYGIPSGGEYFTGGLVGKLSGGRVVDSYWDTESSGILTSEAGEGKTNTEMKLKSTYVGWDFGNVWGMSTDYSNGYPFLQWQGEYDDTVPSIYGYALISSTQESATINFDSDESGTYYYLTYISTDSAPDAATIKAQGTAVVKGSGSSVSGLNTINISGLSLNTSYKVYIIVEDKCGNKSNVGEISLTTQPEGYTQPTRKADIHAEVVEEVAVAYTVDLSSIFESINDGILTYSVSVNGAVYETISTIYSYTPMYLDEIVLEFIAYDGISYSTDTYKVTIAPITSYSLGAGTIEDPYLISTAKDLSFIRYNTDKYFRMVNNIDLSVFSTEKGWDPIDNFNGSLNGDGHKILNLFINRPLESNVGLFGLTNSNASISRIGMISAIITGQASAGGFVEIMVGL